MVDVAGRVSARRPIYFLLLRQKKVAQEKATQVRVSLRCAKGNLRCSRRAGSLQTRFAQTCNLLSPPAAALLAVEITEVELQGKLARKESGQGDALSQTESWAQKVLASGLPAVPGRAARR